MNAVPQKRSLFKWSDIGSPFLNGQKSMAFTEITPHPLFLSGGYNLPEITAFFMKTPRFCFMIPATHRSNVPWMPFASDPSPPHDRTNAAHHGAAPSLATPRSTPNLLTTKTKAVLTVGILGFAQFFGRFG